MDRPVGRFTGRTDDRLPSSVVARRRRPVARRRVGRLHVRRGNRTQPSAWALPADADVQRDGNPDVAPATESPYSTLSPTELHRRSRVLRNRAPRSTKSVDARTARWSCPALLGSIACGSIPGAGPIRTLSPPASEAARYPAAESALSIGQDLRSRAIVLSAATGQRRSAACSGDEGGDDVGGVAVE